MKNQSIILLASLLVVFTSCTDKTASKNEIAFYISIDGNGDFSRTDDSPALKIGFKPFPLDQAGPRKQTP